MWSSLKKFGLQYCDLPTLLWNIGLMLRAMTLNIDGKNKKRIPLFAYVFMGLTLACYIYVYFFTLFWYVFFKCTTCDLLESIQLASRGISSEVANLKLIYVFFNIDKMRKIADNCLACDSQMILGSRFRINLLKRLRIIKKRAIFNWAVIVVNGSMYFSKPFVCPGRTLPENDYAFYGLEPRFESPSYEIAYTLTGLSIIYLCYVPATISAYFIITAGYLESQLLSLSEEILHIWPDSVLQSKDEGESQEIDHSAAHNKNLVNKYVGERLKRIIVRHALLQKMHRELEVMLRGATALTFLLTVLALTAALLGKVEKTYLQLPYAFMQLAMDCFIGQRLIDAGEVLNTAVYNCQWENFDKDNMKMMLNILQSSQKIMMLSAGGVAMLNFSCLMSLVKGIYSAYTTLRIE